MDAFTNGETIKVPEDPPKRGKDANGKKQRYPKTEAKDL
jgi:hypothetical protein